MKMWNLDQSAIEALNALPETGMGFQIVEAQIWGTPTPLLVLGGQQAIDLSEAELIPGDDPTTVLRNGLRVIAALQGDMAITMSSTGAAVVQAAADADRPAADGRYTCCELRHSRRTAEQSGQA